MSNTKLPGKATKTNENHKLASQTTPKKQSFSERFNHYHASNPSPSGKQTKVIIKKVFDEDGQFIAFSVNGFYGARDYFANVIKAPSILCYKDRLLNHITNGRIASLNCVRYVAHDNMNPTVLISSLPSIQNEDIKEDMHVRNI